MLWNDIIGEDSDEEEDDLIMLATVAIVAINRFALA